MIADIQTFFRHLADSGINLTIFYDAFDFDRFVKGLGNTLLLVVLSGFFSIIIGAAGAAILTLSKGPATAVVRAYVALFRNTPLLVQMYFFYFAIGSIMPVSQNEIGLPVPLLGSFSWAVISLSLYSGAFNVETFRSGVGAVHNSYEEAALALGYSRTQAFISVTVPLALRFSFASLSNNLVDLTKATTVAYAVGVAELLYVSNQIWSDSLNTIEMMNVMLLIYLGLTGAVVFIINRVEAATRLPGFGLGVG
ncbi:amino acid ABC transporter permease [Mesorhizobium sp. M1E.F.Ca.ET.045.02.1.1]|uniref:amino acid ABC transporter permease n=1 Tax=Mesorhizobium sp. M1E.F.Ca.ET.045.02.1.1 TaxID=2493672 RepID=UPI000F751163|nr:amino acid ABC transporter permease [Mesorhizobium sp. M1E.F.Ca.ET.045.02.1.1]AZO22084.1 amino acid ABC transporter permease [Mesorhizobium sp. M1E.F.Ca.ET.045.02.1.1]